MSDPDDRRWRYPFTTCTNCGPRFSIVHHLPYDRERTAMGCFPLCPLCEDEYTDPSDRRFHAEPVACPRCGPRLWLVEPDGGTVAEGAAAVNAVQRALLEGKVVALKGLGGFQLACRADDAEAVARLRRRKRRPSKPLAVMVRDLEAVRLLVELLPADEEILSSPRSPIVLAPRRPDAPLATEVAPGLQDLGILLPTTPLHHELVRPDTMPPLVMTSGNRSEEPICCRNREALEGLSGIADLFLFHDRDVVRRIDDSVVRSTAAGPLMVRRARGWVPEPMLLPEKADRPIVGVGGHLQATTCLAVDAQAFVSQHVGDLDTESARDFLLEVIDGLEDFLERRATWIACDGHPDYPSTWLAERLAEDRGGRLIRVQHHLAHAASVLAEHRRFPKIGERSLALCFDGTGWGPDGTAWGGEWLWLHGNLEWSRPAHLETVRLIGGELAVRQPWRVAVAALVEAGREDLIERTPLARTIYGPEMEAVTRLAASNAWPSASGAGRLFEACGALLGLATVNRWEGEAAARLETLAAAAEGPCPPWPEVKAENPLRPPVAALISAAARRLCDGESAAEVARGFHATFSHLAVETTLQVAGNWRGDVALGGGCLINRILAQDLAAGLEDSGFRPLLPRVLPPGDGGLAYGQVVLAVTSLSRGQPLPDQPSPSS
jgi:hydrogenase maturation protein HypF